MKNGHRQYTIRAIPEDLDRALRQRASDENKSLNQVAAESLRRGLGLDEEPVHHDLDDCVGTWKDDPGFDAVLAEHDTVDPDQWR